MDSYTHLSLAIKIVSFAFADQLSTNSNRLDRRNIKSDVYIILNKGYEIAQLSVSVSHKF